jgi:cell division protein FtsB
MAPPRRPPAGRGRPSRGGHRGRRAPQPARRAPSRPAATRRTTRRPVRVQARRAPGGLTGRAAVLGLVVCALALSLAYPVKQYIAQRGAIAQLERERQEAQRRVDALEERRRQLSDPAYVRALARERLQYVMPGDTPYVVVTPDAPARRRGGSPSTPDLDSNSPWYSQLWQTVRAADGG